MSMNGEKHRFFCINCGRESIPIFRPSSHAREKFHRKRMYCPWCKIEVNHIECRNEIEVEEFKIDFENGMYENERKESLDRCRSSRVW